MPAMDRRVTLQMRHVYSVTRLVRPRVSRISAHELAASSPATPIREAPVPPPSLHGHYPASSLLRSTPPLPAASVLSAPQVRCLYLFPWHRWTGSQVPYESPNESHASYTPDTVWPVGRFPPHSSWSSGATPVLMPSKAFRCVTRGSLALISLIHT